MNIALIGYGKMGKAIESLAIERGHRISHHSDQEGFSEKDIRDSDVAIEFSTPGSAVENIKKCFNAGVPVVVGTTGWYGDYENIRLLALEGGHGIFTATNFSLGVHLFFELNSWFSQKMDSFPQYDVKMEEIHHSQKLDAPSGTAITLAEGILSHLSRKEKWTLSRGENNSSPAALELEIKSKRTGEVPGTHIVEYFSGQDTISLIHTAHNRTGFAWGALHAAEWMQGKAGVYTMKDLLGF